MREGLGLHEWEQPFFTCETAKARSRIDRMYINQHISYQLDYQCSCSVLSWGKALSAHRPISFARHKAPPKPAEDRPLSPSSFRRDGWREEVIADFQWLCTQELNDPNPIRHLVILKDAGL